jgi:hypothetical protein
MTKETTTSPRPTVKATGYLAETWSEDTREALIVNPDARPVDLFTWCWGELQSVRAAVSVMHAARGDIEKDDMAALLFHRIEPLSSVMSLAIERLMAGAMEIGDSPVKPAASTPV